MIDRMAGSRAAKIPSEHLVFNVRTYHLRLPEVGLELFFMAYAKNAVLAEELRRTVAAPDPDKEKIADLMRRVVQVAREPGDAYAFGRACATAPVPVANPFDQVRDRYRHFAWKAGAKEGARTETCGYRRSALRAIVS
jgi:hypothetical protein